MEILLQIIGYSFIPFLCLLLSSGIKHIYQGLKEHYQYEGFKIKELPFNAKANGLIKSFGYRQLNIDYCKS